MYDLGFEYGDGLLWWIDRMDDGWGKYFDMFYC